MVIGQIVSRELLECNANVNNPPANTMTEGTALYLETTSSPCWPREQFLRRIVRGIQLPDQV